MPRIVKYSTTCCSEVEQEPEGLGVVEPAVPCPRAGLAPHQARLIYDYILTNNNLLV